ncbi:MAG: hypothetical protein LBP60_01955 [Spirochaetaceae bacterium]|nr:hypothetical protein [Spirochaetaceae bacterium]
MIGITRICSILLLLFLCIPAAFSQEPPFPGEGLISSIEIRGLTKTKPHVARYPFEKFIGLKAETLDLNEVEAAVRDTGILEPVAVELAADGNGGLILQITVREKWSLIPFPLVYLDSGARNFGLFLVDTNAFGLRDQAVVGGAYGSGGWTAMALYNYTPDRAGGLGWNAGFAYSRQERKDTDRDQQVYRRYTADTLQVFPALHYSFKDHFFGKMGISFTGITLQKASSKAPGDAMILGFSPGLSVRYSHWDGYLLSEQTASLEYTFNLNLRGSSFHTAEFQGIYEKSLSPGFRLNLRTAMVWTSSSDPLFESNPKKSQVDVLPRTFSARQYWGFSGGFEKYLVKFRFGTVSALGTWQVVYSQGPISDGEFDHGPAGGVRFYLSRLALPAIGAGIAYNMSSGIFQFTFSLGMGF